MKIDLGKTIFKRLEDGEYTLVPAKWELKTTAKDEDYIALSCKLKEQESRNITVNLFAKGLDITAANVIDHLQLPETTLVDTLDAMIDQELPSYHQTVTVDNKTYYNWYICSKPSNVSDSDEDPAF